MMENLTEEIEKTIHEHAEKHQDHSITRIALTAALITVLAAIAALLGEHQSNEAMLAQLKASDHWSYYQAKGIKAMIVQSEITTLETAKRDASKQQAEVNRYKTEQEDISKEASAEESAAKAHLRAHNILSYAVTLLQVAVGISAMAILTRRNWIWILSLIVAAGGIAFLAWGIRLLLLV